MTVSSTWPNWLMYDVYQSLISINESLEYGQGMLQYLPGLAENWTVSPQTNIYTVRLRPNVTFSNGDPMNAFQLWAWDYGQYYIYGNTSNWVSGYDVFDMANVTFGPATIALLNQSGLINPSPRALAVMENSSWPIYVVNPYEIVFRLNGPFQWFLSLLAAEPLLVQDTQYVLEHGGWGTPTNPNSYFNSNAIPGTGPYEVNGFSENAYVSFAQNPTYWGDSLSAQQIIANPFLDPGHVKNVIIYSKVDDLARYTDLATGAAQIAIVEAADWNLVTANPNKFAYYTLPPYSALQMLLAMNTNLYPTNVTAVRQAIVHAINYTDLIDEAFEGDASEIVAPEYPVFTQFYDLGNFTPYQYNLTLAAQDLEKANISNMPDLNFVTANTCAPCITIGEVLQSDLANINITVNLDVEESTVFYSNVGGYSFNFNNSAVEGQLSIVTASTWAPSELTPADAWVSFVSNGSTGGDGAVYYNPIVQKAVDSFDTSSNITYIRSLVEQAQAQIYNDAPYVSFRMGLWYGDGSLVWLKGVVTGFLVDPLTSGQDTLPIFNTVTFA